MDILKSNNPNETDIRFIYNPSLKNNVINYWDENVQKKSVYNIMTSAAVGTAGTTLIVGTMGFLFPPLLMVSVPTSVWTVTNGFLYLHSSTIRDQLHYKLYYNQSMNTTIELETNIRLLDQYTNKSLIFTFIFCLTISFTIPSISLI